jgi:hypothetical protein
MKIVGENLFIADLIDTDYDSVQYRVLSSDYEVVIDWDDADNLDNGYYGKAIAISESGSYLIEWKGTKDEVDYIAKDEFTIVDDFVSQVQTVFKVTTGNWEILNNQMIFRDSSDVEIFRVDLLDKLGEPSERSVFKRVAVS